MVRFVRADAVKAYSTAAGPADALVRYAAGSASDPESYRVDWNRSFELVPTRVRGGALLLHGLSDSPYSMRALALRLRDEGYHVVGLRLPVHGTVPAGLLDARAEDWSAAVRIAMRHLRRRVPPSLPLYIAGYSTGATLALEYVLDRGTAVDLPAVEGLVLISPAMGVSPAAALAGTQTVLSRIPGLAALAWTSVAPEYDPFRYNSFAMNAGKQIHLLTRRVTERLAALDQGSGIGGLPPILAFQSVADATVEVNALVENLYAHLSRDGAHRLVLFDVNRRADLASLLKPKEDALVQRLLHATLPAVRAHAGHERTPRHEHPRRARSRSRRIEARVEPDTRRAAPHRMAARRPFAVARRPALSPR